MVGNSLLITEGVATFPTKIRSAPLLNTLQRTVPKRLGDQPALIVWGMKDWGFRSTDLDRVRSAFTDHTLIKLPHAAHYIQEDAPEDIANAISARFLSPS